jgi:uncharacterized 2Fe-2S/4Fe-4S cluster protein (DUF4445 family)
MKEQATPVPLSVLESSRAICRLLRSVCMGSACLGAFDDSVRAHRQRNRAEIGPHQKS